MKKRKIIFVGGVHGVGKTTLCETIASRFNIEHFSASNLIFRERQEEHLRNKRVENIVGNQDILVTALNKYLKSENWYLLDGHFCLLSKDNKITKIPYSTYEGIHPSAILLLIDDPKNIYIRLSSRDNIKHDLARLRSLQKQEIDYAEYVKDKLNIPYLMGNSTEIENEICTFIKKIVA